MANFFENKDRRVIPNWRSFKKTIILGELDTVAAPEKAHQVLSISDYENDWINNQKESFAGDLISASISNGIITQNVKEAAQFLLRGENKSTKSQISLAKSILADTLTNEKLRRLENLTFDSYHELLDRQKICNRIKLTKRKILKYPLNSINYVDLARDYSILGQKSKAMSSITKALALSPCNRFVLRSAIRLLTHYEEIEYAHDLIRNNPLTPIDPWVTSAEIAVSTLRGRNSRFIKKGFSLLQSRNFSDFNLTELASSLGTVELLNGSHKKSRDLFLTAYRDPNDNSMAQIEWASSKDNKIQFETKEHINHNFEALALDKFYSKDYDSSINYIFRWFLDQPFTKRPVMLGAHIASSFLKDQEKSRNFLRAGLISHPSDPQLINNLAYSLALENRTDEALEQLNSINNLTSISETTRICLLATTGLVNFRKGFHEEGRKMYLQSMEQSKSINSEYYNWLALLNYAREEVIIKSEHVDDIIELVAKIPDSSEDADIRNLKGEVLEKYSKLKQ